MSRCKTKADLHREYARVIDMCEGTEVKPYKCVKNLSEVMTNVPAFDALSDSYEFALCIVEGKPVFDGDELWLDNQVKIKIIDVGGEILGLLAYPQPGFDDSHSFYGYDPSLLSWQPPKPADPYAPFKEALASGDKWVQAFDGEWTDIDGWIDIDGSMAIYNLLRGEPYHSSFTPEELRIVDKVASYNTCGGETMPQIRVSYNRETREVTAEVV